MSNSRRHRRAAGKRIERVLTDAGGKPVRSLGVSPSGLGEVWLRGRVMLLTPGPPPDDAPEAVREGIARRRLVATTGRCPCGATTGRPHLGHDGLYHSAVVHEPACPAGDDLLVPAIRAWRTGAA